MARQTKKRPTQVLISGIPFEVRYEEKVYALEDKEQKDALVGFTRGDQRQIQISLTENKTEALIESTLLHETLHAILYLAGQSDILEGADPSEDHDKLEEGLVTALENGLSQIYKRNY